MIVIENEGDAWGAYAPDLPGLGVAGASRQEVEVLVGEAVTEHIRMLKELGETVPPPRAQVTYVSVA